MRLQLHRTEALSIVKWWMIGKPTANSLWFAWLWPADYLPFSLSFLPSFFSFLRFPFLSLPKLLSRRFPCGNSPILFDPWSSPANGCLPLDAPDEECWRLVDWYSDSIYNRWYGGHGSGVMQILSRRPLFQATFMDCAHKIWVLFWLSSSRKSSHSSLTGWSEFYSVFFFAAKVWC